MEDRDFYYPKEIALKFGVTRQRIYQMIDAGILPVTKVAGRIRIPRVAWELWLAEQNDRATSAMK